METERFRVNNVKCDGCVNTIRQGLLGIAGVSEVAVTIQGGEVTVGGDKLDRVTLATKLGQLGYPEA